MHHCGCAVAAFDAKVKRLQASPRDVPDFLVKLMAFFAAVRDYFEFLPSHVQGALGSLDALSTQVRSWMAGFVGCCVLGQPLPEGETLTASRLDQFIETLQLELEASVTVIVDWLMEQQVAVGLQHTMLVASLEGFGDHFGSLTDRDDKILLLIVIWSQVVQKAVVDAQTNAAWISAQQQL